MSAASDGPTLVRQIGVGGLALAVVNLIVGVGIFGLPGLLAQALGPGALFAYLGCALLATLIGLCMAEAVSRVPEAGGLMAAAGAAFGPVGASVVGNLLWFSTGALAASAIAVLLLNTLATLIPALAVWPVRTAVLALLFATLAWINIRGVRETLGITLVISVLKFTPLIMLVVVGLARIEPGNLRIEALPSAGDLSAGIIMLFFAFLGAESALSTSGEVVEPGRTIPLGLGLGLLLVGLLYLGLQAVGQGVLGPGLAQATDAPLVAIGQALFGPVGGSLILFATVMSVLAVMLTDLLATPRALFALGERGLLPRALGRVHPVRHTPHTAILAYGAVCFLLAASGTFRQLVLFAAGGTLAMHVVTALAVLKLRRDPAIAARAGYRIPGGVTVPGLTLLAILGLLSTLKLPELGALALLCVLAALPALRRGS
ncbi:MAG TPA: amino acid permease [Gemmatimonadales bacterium]|nr:amino acid permease [Gemmatimonadales bacterium]